MVSYLLVLTPKRISLKIYFKTFVLDRQKIRLKPSKSQIFCETSNGIDSCGVFASLTELKSKLRTKNLSED